MSLQSDLIEQRKAIRQRLGFYGLPKKFTFVPDPNAPKSAWPRKLSRDWMYVASGEKRYPALSFILQAVAQDFGISRTDLISARRHQHLVLPRHVAYYLCKTLTLHGLPGIGRAIGNRDHTTILYGYRKVASLIQRDEVLKNRIEKLSSIITTAVESSDASV